VQRTLTLAPPVALAELRVLVARELGIGPGIALATGTTGVGARPPAAGGTSGTGAGDRDPEQERMAGLVALAQQGDAEAFGEIYDSYVDSIYRYLYYRVGSHALAEDLTSETFLRALRRIDSFSWQGKDIGAWFTTIARNLVTDHVKSSRFRLEVSTADMLDADRADEGIEGEVIGRLQSAVLLDAVRKLKAEQQECIVLRFLQGLSVAETSDVMDRSEGAVKQLQLRAVRALAKLLPEAAALR
jgi:RNA polymerase sigma-70 factor, ECF subfamily